MHPAAGAAAAGLDAGEAEHRGGRRNQIFAMSIGMGLKLLDYFLEGGEST